MSSMQETELSNIRSNIESNIGRRVWLRSNRGRSRSVENEGVLASTFSSVFTVAVDSKTQPQMISYTYGDILTNNLEMKLID